MPDADAGASAQELSEAAWLSSEAAEVDAAEANARRALAKIAADGVAKFQRPQEARATLALGKTLVLQHRWAEACPMLEQAVAQHRAIYDVAQSPLVADATNAFARCRSAATARPVPAAR